MADGRRRAPTIARVAGIDIRIHPTFVLLVVLVVAGAPDAGTALTTLAWIAAVFACIVAHELAHSLVARRRGATVRDILLLPIGGVSELEGLPERPDDELAVAAVGPATSIALGVVFAATAAAAGDDLFPVHLSGGPLLARLAWANLLLGGFNLLPAFPMDGGRILRAILARRLDAERATHWAATIGRALGGAMIGIGVLTDLWITIVGAFVWFGASAEETASIVHARLRLLRVGDEMVRDPLVIDADAAAGAAQATLRASEQVVLPVVRAGAYVGSVDADALEAAGALVPVADLLDPRVASLAADDQLDGAARRLAEHEPPAAVVLDNGRVIGVLRLVDVMAALRRPGRRPT